MEVAVGRDHDRSGGCKQRQLTLVEVPYRSAERDPNHLSVGGHREGELVLHVDVPVDQVVQVQGVELATADEVRESQRPRLARAGAMRGQRVLKHELGECLEHPAADVHRLRGVSNDEDLSGVRADLVVGGEVAVHQPS
jgi:hypothetical protein